MLMVMAIVAILAAVVLAVMSTSRSRGTDGAIKKQLTQTRSQAEIYYTNNSSYTNLCSSGTANVNAMVTRLATLSGTTLAINSGAAQTSTTLNCNTAAEQYAISVKLREPTTATYLCIDSTNKFSQTTTALGANAVTCP